MVISPVGARFPLAALSDKECEIFAKMPCKFTWTSTCGGNIFLEYASLVIVANNGEPCQGRYTVFCAGQHHRSVQKQIEIEITTINHKNKTVESVENTLIYH